MDTLREMNDAMAYIENHLTEEIDVKEAARLARCSEYHFSRMFSFLAGITLSEYIRRRRLTLAAFELKDGGAKVMEVALKYGYGSPDAFARAFQNLHGIPPSEARHHGQSLKAYPRMTFQLSIKGGEAMNYRMVEQEAFRIVGLMDRIPIVFHGENPAITALGARLNGELIGRLRELGNAQPAGMISASTNFSEGRMEEKGELDFYLGVATTKECPEDLACLEVLPSTWAVFEVFGSSADAQNIWGRIYSEWFPSSHYEQARGPELYWYEKPAEGASEFKSEIWIPVTRKQQA